MAHLNKLAIRGIRSFDDKQISVIEFFSPVTVIVGHNGSGKTTIIECLKYATTGEQPPNTRGGAFVHDPKMANEKEVKAQVKLRFHAANGTRMLAVRNLSVTVKKTAGLTMKTLESILALADSNAEQGGKRGVISTKCAEMDAEIPQLLGVSKAVLENVIFCHQEDSYWPLAEPSILKKKFDDIFEATRYTKALDNIKNLRKERVADLKAEKERLLGLSREKQHLDKLKGRVKDATANIAAKEVEYDTSKDEFDRVAEENRKFYEYNSKFREIYKDVENLEQMKARLQRDLQEARDGNFEELPETDEELKARLDQFDQFIEAQKQTLRREERRKQDIEDEIANFRDQLSELLSAKGQLSAEAEQQRQRIGEREQTIREISKQHSMHVAGSQSLERDQVVEFMSRIVEIQRRHRTEFEKLQGDLKEKREEYNAKVRKLENESQKYKTQRQTYRDNLQERQNSIRRFDRELEGQTTIRSELQSTQEELEEKRNRVEKFKKDIASKNFDEQLHEKAEQSRKLEEDREALLKENQMLNMQAESRANLNLKRTEVKTKTQEIQSTIKTISFKFEELTSRQPKPDAIEEEIDTLLRTKEDEQEEADRDATAANSSLHSLEAAISTLKTQISAKQREVKEHEGKIREAIGGADGDGFTKLEDAIKESISELETLKNQQNSSLGSSSVYTAILKTGKQKKTCLGCNRSLDDDELPEFEKYVSNLMKKQTKDPEAIKKEIEEWQNQADWLAGLRPNDVARDQLINKEIPALKAELAEKEEQRPKLVSQAEELADKLDELKQLVKSTLSLKQQVGTLTTLRKSIEKTESEISDLETELSTTGSTKTVADVQNELNKISMEIRTIEKERQSVLADRDRLQNALRSFESKCHQLELEEQKLLSKSNEMNATSERLEQAKKEVTSLSAQIKELDTKIGEAQGPIQILENELQQHEDDFNAKINQCQSRLQDLNMSVDKLQNMNKAIERYVKERKARDLDECVLKIRQCEEELVATEKTLEDCRDKVKGIEREISESGASNTNLRENLRVRKLQKEIVEIQAKIDQFDVEEAARAKRNFETQWAKRHGEENRLKEAYTLLAGELSSMRTQLKDLEGDLKEFKDTNKNYTEQLIRVKVSDMANNDLEKYAKALDNAIMKYHGLKMEEVNDTMKHLWNKTYQGTDIDGIKIKSDVEGGASKRSYNYRVVMTKDQVEMDMRGRCSAGQKMLASIIIRLALSDSFGQNCGILALDEPTNALDTENIDALAESLVDIINERKSHSNFQLIIITHDEGFLRKLGQADVMEYYWRVSRDARQKSVIERQRFR
ncbi:hypothetical protein EST38_g2975 [Candolleomyces aberdarensis]|uniref:DNA repair protein RAD50 n=1 Tax=Candolleomyces aberdarensis TaxID=2316362 RepID=A0A4Q2DTD1_9AGAR|nr:hypothetical protein EST38_g2975 [Candolleomyces aberdarensis]